MPDTDPDYRFTLANERTYLAWVRTSLALLAGGAAVVHLLPDIGPTWARLSLGLGLTVAALIVVLDGYRYYRRADAAIRADRPLPVNHMPKLLTVVVGVVAIAVIVLALF